MHTLEVSICLYINFNGLLQAHVYNAYMQMEEHTSMLTLVWAVDQSFWMMFNVPQLPASY